MPGSQNALLQSRTPSPPSPLTDLASPTIEAAPPSSIEAQSQLCECNTRWQHDCFSCPFYPTSRLSDFSPSLAEGGSTWTARHNIWARHLNTCLIPLSSLQNVPATRDLWHALHQEKDVLIRFLKGWHTSVREKFTALQQAAWAENGEADKEEQTTVVIRGMGLCNKIVGILLERQGVWRELFGVEMLQEERERLDWCKFDCSDMAMKDDGCVEGVVKVPISTEDCLGCENCVEQVEYDGKREKGTQTERGFDPLYDYEEKCTQTEIGEEKERHDSGVGLIQDMEAEVVRLKIDEEGQ